MKVKEHVEDGVKFLFKNANADVAAGRCNQTFEWKSNLGELSGETHAFSHQRALCVHESYRFISQAVTY